MLLNPGYFDKRKLAMFCDDPWLKAASMEDGK